MVGRVPNLGGHQQPDAHHERPELIGTNPFEPSFSSVGTCCYGFFADLPVPAVFPVWPERVLEA